MGLAVDGQRAVEGAEGAVLGAEVGVVDIAIDDVGDHAFRVQLAAEGVGLEAQADEVWGVEVVEGLLAGQGHEFDFTNSVVAGRVLRIHLTQKLSRLGNPALYFPISKARSGAP